MKLLLFFVGVAFALAYGVNVLGHRFRHFFRDVFYLFLRNSPLSQDEAAKPTHPTIGGTDSMNADETKHLTELLDLHLTRLVSGDGKSLEVVSIKNVTKQVVAGMKYTINGTFKRGDKTFDCVISLWHRSWLEDVNEKVKLKAVCEGETIHAKNDDGTW